MIVYSSFYRSKCIFEYVGTRMSKVITLLSPIENKVLVHKTKHLLLFSRNPTMAGDPYATKDVFKSYSFSLPLSFIISDLV